MTTLRPLRPTDAIRLRARATEDTFGDAALDWSEPAREPLPLPIVQPTDDGFRLYLQGAVDLGPDDRVEIESRTWAVNGRPSVRSGLALGVYTTAALIPLPATRSP